MMNLHVIHNGNEHNINPGTLYSSNGWQNRVLQQGTPECMSRVRLIVRSRCISCSIPRYHKINHCFRIICSCFRIASSSSSSRIFVRSLSSASFCSPSSHVRNRCHSSVSFEWRLVVLFFWCTATSRNIIFLEKKNLSCWGCTLVHFLIFWWSAFSKQGHGISRFMHDTAPKGLVWLHWEWSCFSTWYHYYVVDTVGTSISDSSCLMLLLTICCFYGLLK